VTDNSSSLNPVGNDFSGNANNLWALYEKESKMRDEFNIQTLSDHMEGVFLFVRS
jgi:hypothetical protein